MKKNYRQNQRTRPGDRSKRYLSPQEQQAWTYLQDKEMIDHELLRQIFPEWNARQRTKLLQGLSQKGYLQRAQRELYYNPLRLRNFAALALRLQDGYLGLSSALRYYNLLDYEDFTIFILTRNRYKNIPLQGTQYTLQYLPLGRLYTGFTKTKEDGLMISTLEKTLFDCLLKPRYVGLSTITKALYDSEEKMHWRPFLYFFSLTDNQALAQRTGYLLAMLQAKTKFAVPRFVLKTLRKKVKSPVKLLPGNGPSTYNAAWKVQDNVGERNIISWWY